MTGIDFTCRINYEIRQQQQKMIQDVNSAFSTDKSVLTSEVLLNCYKVAAPQI